MVRSLQFGSILFLAPTRNNRKSEYTSVFDAHPRLCWVSYLLTEPSAGTHEDHFPLSMWCSSFRYIRIEMPRAELEMSIAGLSSPDALPRLKEATGALARVERPHVLQTPVGSEENSINPIPTRNEGKSLESPNNSQHDSIESLIKHSNVLDLAQKVLRWQPTKPQEALNRLQMKKHIVQEKLRQKYLRKARRGVSE